MSERPSPPEEGERWSQRWGPREAPSTALLTDHYELTMLRAALQAGTAERRCVFELFARRLPGGRRYGVVAGVGRALRALRQFRFDADALSFLIDNHVVDAGTADWLADFRFTGDVWGYPEGEVYFPGSPIVVVEGGFAECVVLETLLLSIYNHDSAIASAASRMTAMAQGRPCIEMGSRRTQELAAVAAARAAYVAGFEATSNLEAGRRYGVPTRGTSAHAFHPAAPDRARGLRGAGRGAGRGHDPAGRHLRRLHRGPDRGRADLRTARRGPAGLRRPRRARPPGPRAAGLPGRAPDPDRGDQRPRTSSPSPGSPGRRSTATASAPPWSPAAATRPAASSTSSSPGPPRTTRMPRWNPWRRRAPTRCRWAGGSTRCAGSVPTASPRPRWSGWTDPPATTATTASCSSRWSAAARWPRRSRSSRRASGTGAPRDELPIEASKMSRGDPVLPTLYVGDAAPAHSPFAGASLGTAKAAR